jgi:anti-sigma-K factor RskA
MEEIDQILIERYLAGELTEAERNDVERRRAEDPSFRQEIIDYEEAVLALRQKQRDELRQRFGRRDEILDKKNRNERVRIKTAFSGFGWRQHW